MKESLEIQPSLAFNSVWQKGIWIKDNNNVLVKQEVSSVSQIQNAWNQKFSNFRTWGFPGVCIDFTDWVMFEHFELGFSSGCAYPCVWGGSSTVWVRIAV